MLETYTLPQIKEAVDIAIGISLVLITVSLFFMWVIGSEVYSEIKRRNYGKGKRIT